MSGKRSCSHFDIIVFVCILPLPHTLHSYVECFVVFWAHLAGSDINQARRRLSVMSDNKLIEGIDNVTLDSTSAAAAAATDRIEVELFV